ncbi:unnamed protein product [Mytilus edulis]|uniref:Uncharacterized protein n=1 Tax=Mytilus edulis TaxID=6550 RepID=A0A8S3QLR8_MYTED|nr:unnamed protein product [Mytilus edulis]
MGLIPWRLRKYTFQKGNKPYNKGKKYRNKTLPAEKGKFVRLPKDLYDLVTKSVHNKNVQLIPASTKSARFLRPKPPTKTEVEKCAENETKTGPRNFEMEKHVQFAHPQTLQAAIACAVEYDAFTSAQFNPRKPKEVDNSPGLPIRAINKDKNELRENSKVGEAKDNKSTNPDLNTLASTLNSCIKQLTEKLEDLGKQNPKSNIKCTICGRENHTARVCWHSEENQRKRSFNRNNRQGQDDKTKNKQEGNDDEETRETKLRLELRPKVYI